MAHLTLDHADGRYYTRELSEGEIPGDDAVSVEDRVVSAWRRHCDEDAAWQALWRALANERYMRRRERELAPLEDAQRDIDRLQEELARAQRMWRFFEDERERLLHQEHCRENAAQTCVYPQPGCDVGALPPPWRERATELLESYSAERAADGVLHQGCCCGQPIAHVRLSDEDVARLRAAGFLVTQ